MGDRFQISRLGESFSSHTQTRSHARRDRRFGDRETLRERLIEALVEGLAEGGDPRLC
jgi:hypothetical protein